MENMEDVSTSGRVTRSLRKRLTSVDSNDPGSRPATPQLKLVSIPELGSPSRALRTTRRNSITGNITPSKTPAKSRTLTSSESQDSGNALTKRTGRRNIVSGVVSKIEGLSEEGYNAVVKSTPARRSTRLSSKSPTQLETEKTPRTTSKRFKPGPKSRRSKQISDSDSEVEVINLEQNTNNDYKEEKVEDTPNESPTGKSQELIDKSSPKSKLKTLETINLSQESIVIDNKGDQKGDLKLQDEVEKIESKENEGSLKIQSNITDGSNETNVEILSSLFEKSVLKENDTKNESTLCLELSDDVNETEIKTTKTPEKRKSMTKTHSPSQHHTCVESVVMLQKLSPKAIAELCGESTVLSSPPNSKSVNFHDLDDEDGIKSTYPKTPASIKCKSYAAMDSSKDSEDRSFQSDKGSLASFKDASAYNEECKELNESEEPENQSLEFIEFHDAANDLEDDKFENAVGPTKEYTPHKETLCTQLLSSTPMLGSVSPSKPQSEENKISEQNKLTSEKHLSVKSPKKSIPAPNISTGNNVNPEQTLQSSPNRTNPNSYLLQQKDKLAATDNNGYMQSTVTDCIGSNDADEKTELFSKSWTHNVSGCATSTGKIDTITVNNPEKKCDQEVTSESWKLIDKQLTPPIKNNNVEESEEEETSFQKLEFVDDEAMEAPDDYQSGDSMEEEERKEIEENEVIDRGESIGSEDSNDDGEEEDDEENDSFVTSNSEESLLNYSDEDDNFEDRSKKSSKSNRKQILLSSESDSERLLVDKNSTKTQERIISNRKNRILDTSESENEEVSESKSNQANACINNGSKKSNKPLSFEVSRMIDDSTDEETTANETSHKIQLCDEKLDPICNDLSDDKNESITHGLTTETPLEINETRGGYSDKSLNDNTLSKLNELEIGRKNCTVSSSEERSIESCQRDSEKRMSETLSKSSGQVALDSSINNKYEKSLSSAEKCESIVQESSKESIRDKNANKNLSINLSNHSIDGQVTVEHEKPPNKDKIHNSLSVIEESQIPTKLPEKNNHRVDGTTIKGLLNESMEKSNKNGEPNNDLNEPQSENEYEYSENENENVEKEEEDIEIPETQELHKASEIIHSGEINTAGSAEEDCAADTGHMLSEFSKTKVTGLSASVCQAKLNRNSNEGEIYVHHSSFSFSPGVTQKGNESDSSEFEKESSEKHCNVDNNLSESETENNEKQIDIQIDKDEEEKLENLANSCKQFSILNKKRKSVAAPEALNEGELRNSKKQKRKSLQPVSKEEFNPSQSLIENIEDRKRELCTKKDASKICLSKSFNGSCAMNEISSSDESSSESKYKIEASSSSTSLHINKEKNKNLRYILDHCDEVLDAANRAKLELKQNYKKSKVIFPKSKKRARNLDVFEEDSGNDGSFAKDVKQSKEQTTLALKQAFKASAKILMKEAYKNKKENLQTNEAESTDKRLPMELLASLSNTESSPEINSHKKIRSAFVHRMNCATGEIIEETLSPPKKKRTIFNKFELPTGTVLEEPVTPKKNTDKSGFRESPITPRSLGFKVRHILTAGQDEAPELQTSHLRKRRQKIDDPKHVLPKPKWSQSGVFLEEHLPSLNGKQKNKLKKVTSMQACGVGVSTATLNALNFKNSTIFRKDVPRESSHEALKRKERKFARNQF